MSEGGSFHIVDAEDERSLTVRVFARPADAVKPGLFICQVGYAVSYTFTASCHAAPHLSRTHLHSRALLLQMAHTGMFWAPSVWRDVKRPLLSPPILICPPPQAEL